MKEENIIFREYKKEDQEELENIIRKTWNYDKFCSPKITRKMARTYLANCLSNQTFTNVAVINDIPVGIIMGKDIVHYKCPLKLRINQIISNISIYLSKEGRKVIKMFSNIDKIDKDLLKNTNKNYGGEVALFVINSKYRGLGIGKKLFESLKSYMKNQNINEFFLYTDTSCNYGFYEHQKMIRKGERPHIYNMNNQYAKMTFFIYDYKML